MEPQGPHNLDERLEFRIPFPRKGPVEGFFIQPGDLGDPCHSLGAGDRPERGGDDPGVPVLEGGLEERGHAFR